MTTTRLARLLVVDDEATLMRSLCETLTDHGYEATGFTSAQAALAELRRVPFDLMLADLAMPEMDGIALLREALRQDAQLIGVIMTGEGTIGTAVEAMRSGAYDYILKPFKLGVILPMLQRALALRQLRADKAALEQQLRERAAELEVANRELDAFAHTASHDLRAPLAGVAGLSGLLASNFATALPEQASRWLQQIDGEVRRMLGLLDDLMRLSRLGRQALDLKPVDVEALVRRVADEMRLREPVRSLEFRIGALPPANADAALLRQVFVNLLSNALKFSRDRDPAVVEVDWQTVEGTCTYRVRDNGAGFDMAHADKLFEAFQRLHSQADFEGSGVGLSIVQRIVQRHGGRVWAQSTPGAGACFFFTLGGPSTMGPEITETRSG
jgi:signal transduction histidine kinase